jgi:bacillopeptidase F (M6 metalloprotease family)
VNGEEYAGIWDGVFVDAVFGTAVFVDAVLLLWTTLFPDTAYQIPDTSLSLHVSRFTLHLPSW